MPLNTQIERDGQQLRLRWGDFHIAAMVLAATFDSGQGPFRDNRIRAIVTNRQKARRYPVVPLVITRGDCFRLASYPVIGATPLNDVEYALKRSHRFIDATDGELLELLPGDILRAWRSW